LAFAGAAAVGLAVTGRSGTDALAQLSRAARMTFRVRLAVGACAGLAVTVGLAVAVAPLLAGRVHHVPTDPRRYVAPPSLDAEDENPLIRLSGWALNPTQKLFDTDITGPAPARDLRVRLAVLSDYDGVNWRVGGDYREAGRVLPAVNGPGATPATGPAVRQRITIDDLDGRLLPAAPTVHQIDGTRVANDAASGHAYPNLNFFLFSPPALGGQKGTSEQFAASFAVLARMLGLPSRVIVGFQARPGVSTVHGRDALAWPEVLFTGIGWVPFDPLPKPNTSPEPLESFKPKPNPSTPPPSVAPTISISVSPPGPHRPSSSPSAVP